MFSLKIGACRPIVLSVIIALYTAQSIACISCGCSVDTDAVQTPQASSGVTLRVDTTFINQTDLFSNSHRASWADVVNKPADPNSGGGEIETHTQTQLSTLDVGMLLTPKIRANVLLPWIDRSHSTYGFQSTPIDPASIESLPASVFHYQALGDMKLVFNIAELFSVKNLRLNLGVQLPTGVAGDGSKAKLFTQGPAIATPADASLQPGTGSTGLIAGLQYAQAVSDTSDALLSISTLTSVKQQYDHIGDDYRVGNSQTLTFGIRNQSTQAISSQLQLNLNHKSADSGALADPVNTAGWSAYITPGVRYGFNQHDAVYGFLQLPVYRDVSGYQLMPKFILSLGWVHGF